MIFNDIKLDFNLRGKIVLRTVLSGPETKILSRKKYRKMTWKALSGHPKKNFAIGPAVKERDARRGTVGAGSQTSMKSAIIAIIWK